MRTLSRYLLIVTAATLLIPAFASAHEEDSSAASPTPKIRASVSPKPSPKFTPAQFCSRFTDATGKLSSDTSEQFKKLSDNFQQRGEKIKGDFKNLGDKIGQSRSDADSKRAKKFGELEAKATTDAQKAAVAAFEASVNQAVTTRRAAIDAADAAFKAGLLQAVTARQAGLKTAASTYRSAVSTALANAKASCLAGASPDTVRSNLKAALEAARAKLETARGNATKVGPNLDTLKAARKAAVEKANTDFKAAVQTALTTLRAALGASKTTP